MHQSLEQLVRFEEFCQCGMAHISTKVKSFISKEIFKVNFKKVAIKL